MMVLKSHTYSRLVYKRYSVICKMFRFGLRETETSDLISILNSFIVKTSHVLPLDGFFFNITVSLTFYLRKTSNLPW